MNIKELEMILKNENIKMEWCFICRLCPDEGYCLDYRDSKWILYDQERGNEDVIAIYDNESDACEHFLQWIKKNPLMYKGT